MGSAVTNYLRNYLDDGSYVGIVEFSSEARVLSPMTMVTDESSRQALVDVVPTQAGGGTAIGQGLTACAEVFCSALT